MDTDSMERGIARLMIREHLSDLIRPDIGTEDQLAEAFVRAMRVRDDVPMKDVVRAFRMTVNQFVLRRASRLPAMTIRTVGEG